MKAKYLELALSVCVLISCSTTMTMDKAMEQPKLTGVVTRVSEGEMLVKCNEESNCTFAKVSLMPEVKDSYTDVEVSDEVAVYYDGKMENTKVNKVYAITLVEKGKEYCEKLVLDNAEEKDFERCGIDKKLMYKEHLVDGTWFPTMYAVNHFEDEHLLELLPLLHEPYWEWYIDIANPNWAKYDYETKTQIIKINGELVFIVISNISEPYAKYFLYGVEWDKKEQVYALKRMRENNENDVSERLLEVLNTDEKIINIEKDFTNYSLNKDGDYVTYVAPYEEYVITKEDSEEDIYNKVHSYMANVIGCGFSEIDSGYCDIESFYLYKDNKLHYIVSNIIGLESNFIYFVPVEEGKIYFHLGLPGAYMLKDGETITEQLIGGIRTRKRVGNVIYES